MSTIKENLFEMFELDKMPVEKAEEMLEKLSKLVFQAVLVRSLPLLSEEDLGEYEKVVASEEGGDVLLEFLNKKVPEFNKIVLEETGELRRELSKKLEVNENNK